jgi:hypothetical protein
MDPKMGKRLEELLEKLGKQLELAAGTHADITALLAEEPTKGQQIKRCFNTWSEVWGTAYRGDKYAFGNNAAIAGGFGRLLKGHAIEEIERRMLAFLQSREKFYDDARHPVEMFIKAFNKFGVDDDNRSLFSTPLSCTHKPLCLSAELCTKRYQDELRGRRRA